MNVGVFGGSFNPPHVAHVLACALVLSVEEIDRLLVVPTYRHPFAKSLASFDDRLAMCQIAMGWLPKVQVSRVEEELGGESRTLRTLEHLSSVHPGDRLRLVIGADLLAEAPRWFGFDAIERIAPPIVLARPGFDARRGEGEPRDPGPLLPEVSSTEVRAAVARRDWQRLAALVPRGVLSYIREKGLYGTTDAG